VAAAAAEVTSSLCMSMVPVCVLSRVSRKLLVSAGGLKRWCKSRGRFALGSLAWARRGDGDAAGAVPWSQCGFRAAQSGTWTRRSPRRVRHAERKQIRPDR